MKQSTSELVQQERLVKDFIALVKVDSESKDEKKISQVLKEKFKTLGLEVEEDNAAEKTGHAAGNLLIWWAPTKGYENAPIIFFTSHMDTVAPGKGIKPQIDEKGFICTDGSTILGADDKAGIAAILEAIQGMKEQNIPHGGIQFVLTIGEETGLVGASAIDKSKLKAKFGYALDSNGKVGSIATAAPTNSHQVITITGKSAHAGVNPQDGISAIQVAAQAVAQMKLGRIDKETTANIGRFEGGGETNIVVDSIKIFSEARSHNEAKMQAQVESMRKAVANAAKENGASFVFESETLFPAYSHSENSEVVKIAKAGIKSLGLEPKTFASGGGSDANIFNGHGVPTVNLSLGYEDIHTTKEKIKITDLVKVTELVVAIIEEAATQQV